MKEDFKMAKPILLYMPFYLLYFKLIESLTTRNFHDTGIFLDTLIPFNKYFIIPYFLWFIFVPVFGILIFKKDKKEFLNFQILLILGMTLFLFINTFFPTKVELRSLCMYENDIFSNMIRHLQKIDTSTNVFPSIHVYNSIVTTICFCRCKTESLKDYIYKYINIIICVLIILSTMFLKQHSILDVVFGILMFNVFDIFVKKSEKIEKYVENYAINN